MLNLHRYNIFGNAGYKPTYTDHYAFKYAGENECVDMDTDTDTYADTYTCTDIDTLKYTLFN